MPFINFETGPNYYGYEEGVNIANLTLKDINKANSRLAPMRQRRIDEGLLRATRDDPGFISSTPAATKRYCDYAQWTKTALLEAMIARGVATKKARLRDMTKDKMVARLEKADKDSRFPRFLELAPELREMVYLFAMDDKARTRPAPPPISRTSSLVRSESLPVFFKNVTMNVHSVSGPQDEPLSYPGNVIYKGKDRSMQICKNYMDYFNYATEKGWIQHMRRFQWYVSSKTSVSPNAFKRERTEKFQLMFSKNAQFGKMTSEYKWNGRVQVKDHGTIEWPSNEENSMTKGRFAYLVNMFMGVYDDLRLSQD